MNEIKTLIDLIDMRWFLVLCLVVIDAWSIRLILKSKAPLRETVWWSVIVVSVLVHSGTQTADPAARRSS